MKILTARSAQCLKLSLCTLFFLFFAGKNLQVIAQNPPPQFDVGIFAVSETEFEIRGVANFEITAGTSVIPAVTVPIRWLDPDVDVTWGPQIAPFVLQPQPPLFPPTTGYSYLLTGSVAGLSFSVDVPVGTEMLMATFTIENANDCVFFEITTDEYIQSENAEFYIEASTMEFTARRVTGEIYEPIAPVYEAFCPEPIPLCCDDDFLVLDFGEPAGGSYSGEHVTFDGVNYVFTPDCESTGTFLITYTTELGCASCTFEIVVNDLPPVNNISVSLCGDEGTPAQASNVDLTMYESQIHDEPAEVTFTYFEDAALSTEVADPNDVTVNNEDVFYVEVTDANGCTNIASITFQVDDFITVTDITVTLCEEVAGGGEVTGIDLAAYNSQIFAGGQDPDYAWFEDAERTVPVPTPSSLTVTDGDIYYVEVSEGVCVSVASLTFEVVVLPVLDQPDAVTACDSYTLPAISEITGTNLVDPRYYDNSQAEGGEEIIDLTLTESQTVWIYDETDTDPNCSDEVSFVVTINLTPVLDQPSDVVACDEYILPTITGTNLTGNEAYYDDSQANGGQEITDLTLTESQTVWI